MENYTVSTQIHSSRKEMSWLFSNREWDLGYYPLLENDSRNSGIMIIIFTKFAFPVMTNRFEELFHMKASLYWCSLLLFFCYYKSKEKQHKSRSKEPQSSHFPSSYSQWTCTRTNPVVSASCHNIFCIWVPVRQSGAVCRQQQGSSCVSVKNDQMRWLGDYMF